MRTLVTSLLTAAALLASLAVARADGGTPYTKISSVVLHDDGTAYVTLENGNGSNPDGCDRSGMFVIQRTRLGNVTFDAMLRQLNTAMLANKRVRLWLDGCSGPVQGYSRPQIRELYTFRD